MPTAARPRRARAVREQEHRQQPVRDADDHHQRPAHDRDVQVHREHAQPRLGQEAGVQVVQQHHAEHERRAQEADGDRHRAPHHVARAGARQRGGHVADGEHDADGDERDPRVVQRGHAARDARREQRRPRYEGPEGDVPHPRRAHRRAERHRQQLVQGAEDRRRQPAEGEEVRDAGDVRRGVQPGRQLGGDPHQPDAAGEQEEERRREVLRGDRDRPGGRHRHPRADRRRRAERHRRAGGRARGDGPGGERGNRQAHSQPITCAAV